MIALEDFRAQLDVPPERDEETKMLLDAVVDLWEDTTGRPWKKRTGYAQTFRRASDRQFALWLALLPVSVLTKIEERDDNESTWTTLAAADYTLVDGETGRVEKLTGAWAPVMKVTYDGGVDETTAPATPAIVRQALLVQANFLRKRLTDENVAVRGKAGQGGTVTFMERADLHPLFARVALQRARRT